MHAEPAILACRSAITLARRISTMPAFVTFLHHCADEGAAVLVHPWEMFGRERMPKYMMPWTVGMPAETQLSVVALILSGAFDGCPTRCESASRTVAAVSRFSWGDWKMRGIIIQSRVESVSIRLAIISIAFRRLCGF